MNTRTLAYKFRLRPTRGQARGMDRFCSVSRYAWNWALAEYESALDETRACIPDEDGKRATGSVRDILERRMHKLGVEIKRRGKGKVDKDRTIALKSILCKLWSHHRDTEALPWVREGVHSHAGDSAVKRLEQTIAKWWNAPTKGRKRGPWITSSERKQKKRKKKKKKPVGSQGLVVGPPRYKRHGDNPSFTIQAYKPGIGRKKRIKVEQDDGTILEESIRVGAVSSRDNNVTPRRVRVPLIGNVRVDDSNAGESPTDRIPEDATVVEITVRKIADYWQVSVTVIEPWVTPEPMPGLACGIDLGMNAEATIAWSDGRFERVEPPRPMANLGVRLVLLQRKLDASHHVLRCMECKHETPIGKRDKRIRKCKQKVDGEVCGGRIRKWRSLRGLRLNTRLSRLHHHIACVRADHLHKLSDRLTREAAVICTEPHNITGLVSAGVARRCEKYFRKGLKRKAIRRAMLDIGWGELRRQCTYKSGWRGKDYQTLPEGSKTDQECNRCGHENKMPDGTSAYVCVGCHWHGTRQENTALLCLKYVCPDAGKEAAE